MRQFHLTWWVFTWSQRNYWTRHPLWTVKLQWPLSQVMRSQVASTRLLKTKVLVTKFVLCAQPWHVDNVTTRRPCISEDVRRIKTGCKLHHLWTQHWILTAWMLSTINIMVVRIVRTVLYRCGGTAMDTITQFTRHENNRIRCGWPFHC